MFEPVELPEVEADAVVSTGRLAEPERVARRVREIGDAAHACSIQSVSKPCVFVLVCEAIGPEQGREKIGVNATGLPSDSLMAGSASSPRRSTPPATVSRGNA